MCIWSELWIFNYQFACENNWDVFVWSAWHEKQKNNTYPNKILGGEIVLFILQIQRVKKFKEGMVCSKLEIRILSNWSRQLTCTKKKDGQFHHDDPHVLYLFPCQQPVSFHLQPSPSWGWQIAPGNGKSHAQWKFKGTKNPDNKKNCRIPKLVILQSTYPQDPF